MEHLCIPRYGNIIDPMPIMEEFGADALRYYACTCALGEDNAFREKDVVHGKRLCTKLWNIGKFAGMVVKERPEMKDLRPIDRWILSKYNKVVRAATDHYENYSFDKAMRVIEDFTWHEYADNYLEMVKHRTRDADDGARFTLYTITLGVTKMLAPLIPHVTEDIYQGSFQDIDGARSVHVSRWPETVQVSDEDEERGDLAKDIVGAVRTWKADKGLALNRELSMIEIIGPDAGRLEGFEEDILETCKCKELKLVAEADLKEKAMAIKPVKSKIGPTFKAKAKEVTELISKLDPQEAMERIESGELELGLLDGSVVRLTKDLIEVEKKLTLGNRAVDTLQVKDLLIAIGI